MNQTIIVTWNPWTSLCLTLKEVPVPVCKVTSVIHQRTGAQLPNILASLAAFGIVQSIGKGTSQRLTERASSSFNFKEQLDPFLYPLSLTPTDTLRLTSNCGLGEYFCLAEHLESRHESRVVR